MIGGETLWEPRSTSHEKHTIEGEVGGGGVLHLRYKNFEEENFLEAIALGSEICLHLMLKSQNERGESHVRYSSAAD